MERTEHPNRESKHCLKEIPEKAKDWDLTNYFTDMEKSTRDWKEICKILRDAIKLGNKKAEDVYKLALENKNYSRDLFSSPLDFRL